MFDINDTLGMDHDFTPGFTITLFNTTIGSLDKYFSTLISNGFQRYYGSYEGLVTVRGRNYYVQVNAVESINSKILLSYTFRNLKYFD